jgi:hypothetical protein
MAENACCPKAVSSGGLDVAWLCVRASERMCRVVTSNRKISAPIAQTKTARNGNKVTEFDVRAWRDMIGYRNGLRQLSV